MNAFDGKSTGITGENVRIDGAACRSGEYQGENG